MSYIDELLDIEDEWNSVSPILLKDFEYNGYIMNKSYLIKTTDLINSSYIKKENSISLINAIKLRWDLCMGDIPDIKRGKLPLHEFIASEGLELFIDLDEILEIRINLTSI